MSLFILNLTVMRTLFLMFCINILSVAAAAQDQPFHIFEYDVPVAHYSEDDITISNRLFGVGSVVGDLLINECTAHDEYMSGIRFIFKDNKKGKSERAMFALKCNSRTGEMYASWVRRISSSPDDVEDVVDINKRLKESVGTRVPVSLQFINNIVSFEVGGKTFIQKLSFKVEEIELIGVGSKGIARFFEEDLVS